MASLARKEWELFVRAGNQPDALPLVLSVVSQCGVNVLAYCTYTDRDDTILLLVTSDAVRAREAIERRGFATRMDSVVMVGAHDRVGAVAQLGSHLAGAGIRILYSYASSADRDTFHAVFKTADDSAATHILNRVLTERLAA